MGGREVGGSGGPTVVSAVTSHPRVSQLRFPLGLFCVRLACSPRVCAASLQVLQRPPTVQRHARQANWQLWFGRRCWMFIGLYELSKIGHVQDVHYSFFAASWPGTISAPCNPKSRISGSRKWMDVLVAMVLCHSDTSFGLFNWIISGLQPKMSRMFLVFSFLSLMFPERGNVSRPQETSSQLLGFWSVENQRLNGAIHKLQTAFFDF